MLFDYNVNHYTHDDLKTLFNVKDGEQTTPEELDIRISNIKYSAELKTKNPEELKSIHNFLLVAKEKYLSHENYSKIQYNNIHPYTEALKTKFIPNKLLDINEHAIIEKTPDITIPTEIKYFNVSSSDRDKIAWPLSSCFEFDLPDSFKDVTFLSLYDYNFYCHVFNFTSFYQNTKFTLNSVSYTLDDGYYSETDLMSSLSTLLLSSGTSYTFSINSITKRLEIESGDNSEFTLDFSIRENYESSYNKWQPRNIYDLKTSWGLGYFLGFEKQVYTSSGGKIISPNIPTLVLNYNVFLEVDGFNHISQSRDKSGTTNSYFSRIPLYNGVANEMGGFERANISVEKLSKLKIKLRFHTGIVLDLQNQDYDLTFVVGCKK